LFQPEFSVSLLRREVGLVEPVEMTAAHQVLQEQLLVTQRELFL
jgi:hypothetical protein